MATITAEVHKKLLHIGDKRQKHLWQMRLMQKAATWCLVAL